MTDTEHGSRWLADDPFVLNTLLLVAASSLAVALTSCLWHHIYDGDSASPFSDTPSSENQPSSGIVAEQKDHKSTRSKERRRRAKNPFRDLLKGGKKSRALLKAARATDHDGPPSADTVSTTSAPSNDSVSSTSRSHSPEPARDPVDPDRFASRTGADDGSSVKDTVPDSDTTPTSSIASSGNASDRSASGVCPPDRIRSHSCTPDSMTATDTQLNISSASTVTGHADELAPSSPHVSAPCVPLSRDLQTEFMSEHDTKPVCARTTQRIPKIDPAVRSSRLSTVNSVESVSPVPCPSLSMSASTNHSVEGAGRSTPTHSASPPRSPSPSEDPACGESNTQPLHPSVATTHTELASLRDALKAARLREEQLRVEAKQASKERDELCWRWNEDAGIWRRREAELQAQIHHLMQQFQAYAVAASYPSSGFSSPTSPHAHSSPRLQHHALAPFPLPAAIQTQNSASAPAHVQALLASAPMLISHPPGFAAPAPGGLYGMSPMLWPGMGLCVPNQDPRHGTPDSSPSGSSSRGRRRPRGENDKSVSDESSLGDLDGVEDGSEDDDPCEEDIFRNNALADAILKRPESIRDLGGGGGGSGTRKRSAMGRGGVHGTRALRKHGSLPADTPAVVQ